MSATEASLVKGLISSICTVLDAIAAVYNDAKDAENVPIIFREVTQRLPVLRDALRIAKEHIDAQRLDEESSRSIKPALAGCKDKALRLEVMFRKVVLRASTLGSEPYRLAVDALGKGYRVEILMKGMLEDVKVLAENQAVNAVAEAEARKLVTAIEELSGMPPSLSEDASGDPINNYSAGTINANTSGGTRHNVIGSGKQFVGQNQYFLESPEALDPAKLLAEEQKGCLGSLSFATIDARRRDIASAHQDTCKWIFQTVQFQQWRNRSDLQSHNGVLWIKGKPGTGKSTLMKYILQHCPEFFRDHITVAYFFNTRGDSLEKTPLGMLRSLTSQLLEQDLLYERFLPRFRDKEKKHKTWEWRGLELKEFLLSETRTPQSKPLLFLIDALDECRESDVREVVMFLEELSINAFDANVTLNICLSSRHYPTLGMNKKLELVVEQEKEHDDDIVRYVRDNLRKRDEDIEREILKKASGVFMWVVLVVAMLNRAYDEGKVEAMQQRLRELPGDLEEVFNTLLSKYDPYMRETISLLQWVLFARRGLKPEELYFAMMAGTNAENLGAWDQSKVTNEDIQRRITSSSRGLIEIRKEKEKTVQFIHETVNDFLLRNGRLQMLDPTLESNPIGTSHNSLTACCMTYLMMKGLPLAKDSSHTRNLGIRYPFLEYASTHVLRHAEEAQRRDALQKQFLHCIQNYEDFERLRHFHNSFERIPGLGCGKGVTPLYALSFHGCYELVKVVLSESWIDINTKGGPYGSALQAAAARGEEEIVKMLLEKGADANAQGGIYGSALQVAVIRGEEEIVRVLLKKGADVNAYGGHYGSALQAAAARGEEEIVRVLLEKGADANARGGIYGSALQTAAIREEEIMRMLLEKGGDASTQGELYGSGSALQTAVLRGEKEIVNMLLKKGADVNTQGGLYGSALQAAAARGEEEIVRMLLEEGADTNAQGGIYGSALQAAAARGEEEIVRMLLEKGADNNAQGGIYGSALQAAAARGEEEIVRVLLEKGADVNAYGGHYGSALQAAAAKGEEEIVRVLLEKGADANAQGGIYGSALQIAAVRGEKDIVRVLLKKGADVNAYGGLYGSALQAAAVREEEEIVVMLLEEEANANAQGGIYGSALQAAAVREEEDIVKMLLEKETDVNAPGGLVTSALQTASAKGEKDIVRILLENGVDANARGGLYDSALQAAAAEGRKEIVEILLEKGVDVNVHGGLYGSALQAAAVRGKTETVRMLLKKGANVNAGGGIYSSALQAATVSEEEEIVKMLLKKGADANTQGGLYSSALQAAAARGEKDIVRMLLEKGTALNAQSILYSSSLQTAAFKGEKEIVRMLLEKGADVNAHGGLFGSALQAAAVGGKKEIVGILLEKGADANTQGGLYHSAPKANMYETYQGKKKSGSDDLVDLSPRIQRNFGRFFSVATAIITVFFIFRLPVKRWLKFRP